jgi:tRNA pseudouridine13 synthase
MVRIKQIPEDFEVREIFEKQPVREGHRTEDDDYVWFTMKKTNYDLFKALKTLSRFLNVSIKRFGYAGTKDKRAVTYQKISVWKIPAERLESLRLRDIELSDFEERRERINLGDLAGNEFRVVVRDIGMTKKRIENILEDRMEEIRRKGVINLFGKQRFGSYRKVTHVVGHSILRNDPEQAVKDYLTITSKDEPTDTRKFRKNLAEDFDLKRGLRECPRNLRYESVMLNHLVYRKNDYAGALRKLPKNLRRMFVHAYQAHLWNEIARISKLSTVPMIGFRTDMEGFGKERGKIEKLLEKEGIRKEDFQIRSMPELSSEGSERKRTIDVEKLKYSVEEDDLNEGKRKLILEFGVQRGSYATVVVDQITEGMK